MDEQFPDHLAPDMFLALDHAVDSISGGDPLIPFVVTTSGEGRDIKRFAADQLEECVEFAMQHIEANAEPGKVLSLAYDGYLTIESTRTEALYIQVFEGRADQGYLFAQRYKRGLLSRKPKPTGNPAFLGIHPLRK